MHCSLKIDLLLLDCSGIEASLETCAHSNNNSTCGPMDGAGVRCSTDLHDLGM